MFPQDGNQRQYIESSSKQTCAIVNQRRLQVDGLAVLDMVIDIVDVSAFALAFEPV